MSTDQLQVLYDTYRSLHSQRATLTPDEFDTQSRRLRKKIRDAGGSVTTLNLSSSPVPRETQADVPREPRQPRLPREPRAPRADSPLHRTTSKGSSAPTYRPITAGGPPAPDHFAKVIAEMNVTLREINYHDLSRIQGPAGCGLGFVVYADVTASMIISKFIARYPTITPEWFSVSRPATPLGTHLIVVGPVEYTNQATLSDSPPTSPRWENSMPSPEDVGEADELWEDDEGDVAEEDDLL